MRFLALLWLALLAACSRPAWHMTDVTGSVPRLEFYLSRDGRPVTAADFRGKVVALYFGYTHCPDVCPTTLANLTDVIGKVGGKDIVVLFVSVDPDRDTAPVLDQYAAAFSPQVVGLRGLPDQLADVARRYRVAYSVAKSPTYDVMHSNAVFFFDKDGKARLVTTDTTNTAAMADDVKRLLR